MHYADAHASDQPLARAYAYVHAGARRAVQGAGEYGENLAKVN